MLGALVKAFAQLSDPAFRRVLVISVAAAVLIFAGLWMLAWYGLAWAGEVLGDWLATRDTGDLWPGLAVWLFGAAGLAGVLIVTFFLFPAVMVLVMSFLLDSVVDAVERRYYPGQPPARSQPLGEATKGAFLFALASIALNLLAAPLYLVLLFVPPLNLFVFYLLNGYLLGREYFELVGARRFDLATVGRLYQAFRGRLMMAGVIIAFLLTIPVLNLVMPLVATGFMVHVFEGLRRRPRFAAVLAAGH